MVLDIANVVMDDDPDSVIIALIASIAAELADVCPACRERLACKVEELIPHAIKRGGDFAQLRIVENEPPRCRH
jgi:hypothetical protein